MIISPPLRSRKSRSFLVDRRSPPSLGGATSNPGQADFQIAINTQGRLTNGDEFGDIVVRAGPDGQIGHLRDVARIELGSDNYALRALIDGQDAVGQTPFSRSATMALVTRL